MNTTNTPVLFGNLNADYVGIFRVFSPEKLFTPIGSTITNASFFLPGTTTPATVSSFGAVFTDVDLPHGGNRLATYPASSWIECFDAAGKRIFFGVVPASPGDGGFSFLGVAFTDQRIARVRIKSGNRSIGRSESSGVDVVALDDFIYGEPQAAP